MEKIRLTPENHYNQLLPKYLQNQANNEAPTLNLEILSMIHIVCHQILLPAFLLNYRKDVLPTATFFFRTNVFYSSLARKKKLESWKSQFCMIHCDIKILCSVILQFSKNKGLRCATFAAVVFDFKRALLKAQAVEQLLPCNFFFSLIGNKSTTVDIQGGLKYMHIFFFFLNTGD